jgi:hypothetical protein
MPKPLPHWARRLQIRLETATRCRTCQKKTLVANTSGSRTPVLERVTPETHCTCPGGPAYRVETTIAQILEDNWNPPPTLGTVDPADPADIGSSAVCLPAET